jgi:predicted metal-dependent phosphotriesterase family hydrolase
MSIAGRKSNIQTVLGVISSEKLEYCQCHEHLFIKKGKSFKENQALWMDDLNKSIKELKLYKQSGGVSLVDAQPVGCGRMAGYLLEASIKSGVQIIASTGFHKLQFYLDNHWVFSLNEEELAGTYIDEIENGMYIDGDNSFPSKKVGAKAGVIKAALDSSGIRGDYVKLFHAAANASLRTGAPIMCHIEKGSNAFEAIDLFLSKGVSPSSIILCHLDRAKYHAGYHRKVAQTGVYLEYDTIGRFKYHSDHAEAELILQMVEAGYENRILLGLDTTRERLRNYGGSIGLDYIKTTFIPLMIKCGIDNGMIEKFTVINPGEALKIK